MPSDSDFTIPFLLLHRMEEDHARTHDSHSILGGRKKRAFLAMVRFGLLIFFPAAAGRCGADHGIFSPTNLRVKLSRFPTNNCTKTTTRQTGGSSSTTRPRVIDPFTFQLGTRAARRRSPVHVGGGPPVKAAHLSA
jgi:hypothetical protein